MAFAALELCCQLTVQVGNAFLSRSRSNSLKFDLGTESRLSDFNPANVLMEEGPMLVPFKSSHSSCCREVRARTPSSVISRLRAIRSSCKFRLLAMAVRSASVRPQ